MHIRFCGAGWRCGLAPRFPPEFSSSCRVKFVSAGSVCYSWQACQRSGRRAHGSRPPTRNLFWKRANEAPRLTSLGVAGQPKWENRDSEVLIPSADISDKPTSLHWSFNREASQISEQRVAFVYDSASPHLRLTWEWRTRQTYGPIEHQIRIENLDNQEIWIPMQDSLAFNWQVDPQSALEHLFVEKGANTPSPVGTHQVAIDRGIPLDWHVQHLWGSARKRAREIIPWSLVRKQRLRPKPVVCGHRVQRAHSNFNERGKRFSPGSHRTES